jgi:hypothetical protein
LRSNQLSYDHQKIKKQERRDRPPCRGQSWIVRILAHATGWNKASYL